MPTKYVVISVKSIRLQRLNKTGNLINGDIQLSNITQALRILYYWYRSFNILTVMKIRLMLVL